MAATQPPFVPCDRKVQREASLLLQRCGKLHEIGLGLGDALREGSFQPKACFSRVALARNAAREIAAEHQLGMAMAQFGGGAEPALRGRSVDSTIFATAIHGAEGKHGPAMTLGSRFLEQFFRRDV